MQSSMQQQILDSIISQVENAHHSLERRSPSSKPDPIKLDFQSTVCSLQQDIKVEVIECYKQVNPDICGFHCLFNILKFLNYCLDSSLAFHKEIVNSAEFWKSYEETFKYLINHYPNKNEIKDLHNLGPLDRVHMEYFLEHNEKIKEIRTQLSPYQLFIQPFYFGFGIIQNNEEELEKLQKFAIALGEKPTETILLFPLGVTIHWSLLIILLNKEGNKRYFYLDSKNIHLKHIFDGNIQAAIKELEEADKYGREKARDEIEERRQVSWMKDLKRAIEMIVNVINLKKTLTEYVIEGHIDETTNDFQKYLANYNLNDLTAQETVLKIYEWFEDEYRPQVITHNLFGPLKNSNKLSSEYYQKLMEFLTVCQEFEKTIKQFHENLDSKLIQDISNFIKDSQNVMKQVKIDS